MIENTILNSVPYPVAIIGLLLLILGSMTYLTYSEITLQRKTKLLFDEVLQPMVYKATTLSEVREAYEILFDKCYNGNGSFKIHLGYRGELIELKSILKGKEFILETQKLKKQENSDVPSGVIANINKNFNILNLQV